jgi:hypothetical protein
MKNLFILGAGASREAGGPLMADFLDMAESLLRQKVSGIIEAQEHFNNVFNACAELQTVHAKSYLDLDNIEILFGAIEMANLINKIAQRNKENILELKNSLITLIYKTLESSINFPVRDSHIYPAEPYGLLIKNLYELNSKRSPQDNHKYSFITFNYDLAMDYALNYYGSNSYNYCLTEDSNTDENPYLKLHGSINWGICEKCNQIIPRYIHEANFELWPDTKSVHYDLGSKLSNKQHCNKPLKGPPIIIPPTWNKTGYHEQILNVWTKAAKELETAENIFIIGYSLPDSDLFFRYLFALGSESSTRIKRFWVFNPDSQGGVENRFKELIGRGIESRFRYFAFNFRDAVPIIVEALKQP